MRCVNLQGTYFGLFDKMNDINEIMFGQFFIYS